MWGELLHCLHSCILLSKTMLWQECSSSAFSGSTLPSDSSLHWYRSASKIMYLHPEFTLSKAIQVITTTWNVCHGSSGEALAALCINREPSLHQHRLARLYFYTLDLSLCCKTGGLNDVHPIEHAAFLIGKWLVWSICPGRMHQKGFFPSTVKSHDTTKIISSLHQL